MRGLRGKMDIRSKELRAQQIPGLCFRGGSTSLLGATSFVSLRAQVIKNQCRAANKLCRPNLLLKALKNGVGFCRTRSLLYIYQ